MPDGTIVDTGAVSKVVASGVTITVGLSDDRQMTFQSGFEGDETDASINARFDRMMRFADRLKAKYEIVQIRKDVIKATDTLSQLQEDWARVKGEHQKVIAQRQVELQERHDQRETMRKAARAEIDASILELQEKKRTDFQEGADEHVRSGRQGAYKPQGARLRNQTLYETAIEKAKAQGDFAMADWDATFDQGLEVAAAEITKAEGEADQYDTAMTISVKRHTEFLETAQARLVECQAMLDGG